MPTIQSRNNVDVKKVTCTSEAALGGVGCGISFKSSGGAFKVIT